MAAQDEGIADPLIAACCQGSDEIVLHRLTDGEVLGQIAVGEHPVHAVPVDGRVYVATMNERSVTVIDGDGQVDRIGTGVLGPSHFAHLGKSLFVTCTAGDVVAAIDTEAGTLRTRIGVGRSPHELAATDTRVFVGSRDDGVVSVIDVEQLRHVADIKVGADARIEDVVVWPDSGQGVAVDRANGEVVRFDTGPDHTITARAQVGGEPYDLLIDGDRLFVPGADRGVVHEFDRAFERIEVHSGYDTPVGLCVCDGKRWVIDRSRSVLESLDGTVIEMTAGAIAAKKIPDGLVVSHYDDHRLSVVSDGTVVWSRETGSHPLGTVVI